MVTNRRRMIRRVNESMQLKPGVVGAWVWGLRALFAAILAMLMGWLTTEHLGLALGLILGFLVWLIVLGKWLRK